MNDNKKIFKFESVNLAHTIVKIPGLNREHVLPGYLLNQTAEYKVF